MTREQLREKISEISNSEFPLIDFFNDISRNKDPRYDKERAYEDIEKIYDVFMYYIEKSEKLEKVIKILKDILIAEDITRKDGSHTYFLCERNKFPVYTISLTKEQYEPLKEVEKMREEIKMKVRKETRGKFPNYDVDKTYHTTYKCPKCECTIHLDWHEVKNYCPTCGQKLDWSDCND